MFVAFTFFYLFNAVFLVLAVVLFDLNAPVAVERIFGKSNLQVTCVLVFLFCFGCGFLLGFGVFFLAVVESQK